MCTMYARQFRVAEQIWDETVDVLSQLGVVLGICASHGFRQRQEMDIRLCSSKQDVQEETKMGTA